jgi:uncharacterized protein (TIGR03086 family)
VTADHAPGPLLAGVGLLERAVDYLLGVLHTVSGERLPAPTPCRRWDLRTLLAHLDESLLALHEAACLGHVRLVALECAADDPVAVVRDRASGMLGAWTGTGRTGVTVGGAGLTTGIVAAAGAVEVAVHGWDVACAAGRPRPIPPALADDLLALLPFLVSAVDRPARFAAPVPVTARAAAGDRLVAFLGRRPQRPQHPQVSIVDNGRRPGTT